MKYENHSYRIQWSINNVIIVNVDCSLKQTVDEEIDSYPSVVDLTSRSEIFSAVRRIEGGRSTGDHRRYKNVRNETKHGSFHLDTKHFDRIKFYCKKNDYGLILTPKFVDAPNSSITTAYATPINCAIPAEQK